MMAKAKPESDRYARILIPFKAPFHTVQVFANGYFAPKPHASYSAARDHALQLFKMCKSSVPIVRRTADGYRFCVADLERTTTEPPIPSS